MKCREWTSRATKSILTVAAFAFATSAFADGYVEILNRTEKRVCFGKITNFLVEGEGTGRLAEGWICVDPQGSFRFDIGLNEYIYVSAIDELNNDFLENRLLDYSPVPTWAPIAMVESFGVAVEDRFDGLFLYSYYFGDDDWSDDMLVATVDTLDHFLVQAGFRKITGRVFRGADYPNGVSISINF